MKLSAEVEAWFTAWPAHLRGVGAQRQRGLKHPQEQAMRRVLEINLDADKRMTAYIQYGSLNFGYKGMLAAFVQIDKKPVSLMYGNGAKIPGKFPHLEGSGPNARFMRFKDIGEVNARAAEMKRIAIAWCDLKDDA
jgi:hypothetical protein